MPIFSEKSKIKLLTCDDKLQRIFNEVIKHFDCTILCGHRKYTDQQQLFNEDKSKVQWKNSRHNIWPSMSVDACPYPIDWNDLNRYRYFAGFVMGVAVVMGVTLRWGGDWDQDTELKDNKFNDFGHFEIPAQL